MKQDECAQCAERALIRAADPGVNTILLDMAQDIGNLVSTTRSISDRLAVVEPALWELVTERERKIGFQLGVKKYVTAGRAAWLAVIGALGWIAAHVPGLPPFSGK